MNINWIDVASIVAIWYGAVTYFIFFLKFLGYIYLATAIGDQYKGSKANFNLGLFTSWWPGLLILFGTLGLVAL